MKSILLAFATLIVSMALYMIIANVIGASTDEQDILAVAFVISLQLCAVIGILLAQKRNK
ncbi:hypothetical protein ACFQZE_04275 [Paenibacillus sp. GCM10027627]|uniref:hypothetical protein n=1 Tax=unclassified Paenibacillus TaxID=185978 RepID=UPI003638CB23